MAPEPTSARAPSGVRADVFVELTDGRVFGPFMHHFELWQDWSLRSIHPFRWFNRTGAKVKFCALIVMTPAGTQRFEHWGIVPLSCRDDIAVDLRFDHNIGSASGASNDEAALRVAYLTDMIDTDAFVSGVNSLAS